MITLLFATYGLAFEVKGVLPKDIKPDCFLEVDVIGLGVERLNMALIYAIREVNPEEYKTYKAMTKEIYNRQLLEKFGAGKGLK